MGVNPDLEIHVFRELLEHPEEEPTEVLTDFDGEPLGVPDEPELRPDRELLAHRREQAREG